MKLSPCLACVKLVLNLLLICSVQSKRPNTWSNFKFVHILDPVVQHDFEVTWSKERWTTWLNTAADLAWKDCDCKSGNSFSIFEYQRLTIVLIASHKEVQKAFRNGRESDQRFDTFTLPDLIFSNNSHEDEGRLQITGDIVRRQNVNVEAFLDDNRNPIEIIKLYSATQKKLYSKCSKKHNM